MNYRTSISKIDPNGYRSIYVYIVVAGLKHYNIQLLVRIECFKSIRTQQVHFYQFKSYLDMLEIDKMVSLQT